MTGIAAVPVFSGDPAQLEACAQRLQRLGGEVETTALDVHTTWQGLAAVYRAPEAERLFAATTMVRSVGTALGNDLGNLGGILAEHAGELQAITAQLDQLRAETAGFAQMVREDSQWRTDPAKVAQHDALVAQITALTIGLADTQLRTAAQIDALTGEPVPQGPAGPDRTTDAAALTTLAELIATGQVTDARGVAAFLRSHVPESADQLWLVRSIPGLLDILARDPNAARDAGLLSLDAALYGVGGLLYDPNVNPAWAPYANLLPNDPQAWQRAVRPLFGYGVHVMSGPLLTLPLGLASPPAGGYTGGGFLLGPDGRRYPVVVPNLIRDGVAYQADSSRVAERLEDLGGGDTGWVTLYTRTGFDRFGEPPSFGERLAAFGWGTAGNTSAIMGEATRGLSISATGVPDLASAPGGAAEAPPPLAPPTQWAWRPDANGVWGWVDANTYEPNRAISRAYPDAVGPPAQTGAARAVTAADAGASLAVTLGQGAAAATAIEDTNVRAYQVLFEQNGDGRVRAIVRTYMVGDTPHLGPAITPTNGYVDQTGQYREVPIRYLVHTQISAAPPPGQDSLPVLQPALPDQEQR